MPKFKGLAAVAAGAALMSATTVAAATPPANPAAGLSLSPAARAAAPAAGASRLGAAVPTTTLISIGVLAALVAIVLVATKGDDNSDSN
ncbi:hypothetical protein [uncultured Sphingomonas sp.]|uniref:hypothetical protein n=1 Tax=uncultured Sphingomonas sp. TaxID=158754 RepID=UPI0035CA40B7